MELAESVSMAMLTVLETLTPTERAVFVLREVRDVPYEEIAAALDKNAAAVRQTAHRAREHVAARRPRRQAARHPITGATKVVAFLSKFATLAPTAVVDTVWLNGALGGRIVLDGKLNTVISFIIDDGRISRMYAVRNPHKLGRLNEEAVIAR